VDRQNVLATSRLWRDTVPRNGPRISDVKSGIWICRFCGLPICVDPGRQKPMIANHREICLEDILTDEASVISGSMGLMPSALRLVLRSNSFERFMGFYSGVKGKLPEKDMPIHWRQFYRQSDDVWLRLWWTSTIGFLIGRTRSLRRIVTEDIADGGKSLTRLWSGELLAKRFCLRIISKPLGKRGFLWSWNHLGWTWLLL